MDILPTSSNQNHDNVAGLSGTPKTMFILGLSMGIGGMAIIALIFMMTMFMQGTSTSASQDDGTTIAAADAVDAADAAVQEEPQAMPVPNLTDSDHVKGPDSAAVTLIVYSDFECPYSSSHVGTLEKLLADYPNDVRVAYRHFPLSFNENAGTAAEASECAAVQGKFWEMHDRIFELADSEGLSEEGITNLAGELGLDMEAFNACMENDETYEKISVDYQGGIDAGVSGTPGTFVNGKLVEGAIPFETFKQIMESEGASG